jgi:hypothetical protein
VLLFRLKPLEDLRPAGSTSSLQILYHLLHHPVSIIGLALSGPLGMELAKIHPIYLSLLACKISQRPRSPDSRMCFVPSHLPTQRALHRALEKKVHSLCCVKSNPYLFLSVTRCLEYLSSGLNLAGCALFVTSAPTTFFNV